MHSAGRRLKAARMLGGYDSQRALSDALGLVNFGERTIRAVENDTRALEPHERDAVCRLVGISSSFFHLDLNRLPTTVVVLDENKLTLDEAQLRVFEELLPQAVELGRELRLAREAREATASGTDLPPAAGEGGDA
jgi:hypothetical protein